MMSWPPHCARAWRAGARSTLAAAGLVAAGLAIVYQHR
jgi:hypothetical protein